MDFRAEGRGDCIGIWNGSQDKDCFGTCSEAVTNAMNYNW